MSKFEVMDYLGKHPKDWYTVKDLAKTFKITDSSMGVSCLKLRKDKWVDYKKGTSKNNKEFVYKHKGSKK